jgi:hypothetical protein
LVNSGEINTKEKAAALVEEEAKLTKKRLPMHRLETLRLFIRVSIGYFTGYYDHKTADKVMELFETEHPIFGKKHPTPAEAFTMGIELGKQSKGESI